MKRRGTKKITPLFNEIQEWVHASLKELPKPLVEEIRDAFFPRNWDDLAPDQRRSVAQQWDRQNDPVFQDETDYWYESYCKKDAIEEQLERWQNITANTAEGLAAKEQRITQLSEELEKMEEEFRLGEAPFSASVLLFA